jgi:hypothetical protein
LLIDGNATIFAGAANDILFSVFDAIIFFKWLHQVYEYFTGILTVNLATKQQNKTGD